MDSNVDVLRIVSINTVSSTCCREDVVHIVAQHLSSIRCISIRVIVVNQIETRQIRGQRCGASKRQIVDGITI